LNFFSRIQVEEAVKENIEEWYHYLVDKLPLETTRLKTLHLEWFHYRFHLLNWFIRKFKLTVEAS